MYIRSGWSHGRLIAPVAHALAISTILLVAIPVPSAAQPLAVDSGSLVHVVTPGFRGKGIVSHQDGETLTLTVDNRTDPLLIPWNSIGALSVRERRTAQQGAFLGSRVGSGAGLTVVFYGILNSPEWSDAASLTTLFVSVGVGALIGARRPGSRWRPVNIGTFAR